MKYGIIHFLRVGSALAVFLPLPHLRAQDTTPPVAAITAPTDGAIVGSLAAVSGWATDDSGTVSSVTFSLHEVDPSGGAGRYWNGAAWQGSVFQLATTRTGTNWSNASGVTLPPLNSGIRYEITATAIDPSANVGQTIITVTRATDILSWDPGTTHLGTAVKANPHALGGPFIYKIVTQATTVGGWRTALNVTSGEANLYLNKGAPPTTVSYNFASTQVGSDGWVLQSSQFAESEDWYYLVSSSAGATWNLVSGEPYVLDLGTLPGPAASGVTNVTVGAEGYRFFRTTTPPNLLAWQLWLGGAANAIQVKKAFIPLTGYLEREQAKAMLLVPDYLEGSVTYFVGVPGAPGQALSFTSKQQPVADVAFNSTQSSVVVTGFPYTTYRVAVPINQIAWEVATTPLAGDPNVAARRGKVPNEFNNSAYSDVAGTVEDSFTMVPPSLSDGTFYITVYGGAAHTFTLRNGEPIITPRVFLGTTTNNLTTRAGWRFYVLTNIAEQIGTLGWELDLSNQVAGTEIALRRNAVPGRWYYRSESSVGGEGYVDYSGTAGFLQRPGHQADIWYVGLYQPATSLGAFTLRTRAIPAPSVAFDNGSATVTNLAEGRWTYLRVDVPADMFGWDARLTNVTAGSPRLAFRRDLLPDGFSGWSFASEWPSGTQNSPGVDWTGLNYSTSGEDESGRIFAVGRDNMLQSGTYYVGICSSSGAASFKFISRGIGTNYAIGVTNLAFSGTGSRATNSAGLPPREAAYYRLVVPSNSPNWLVRLTPTTGEALLDVQKNVLPNIAAGAYGNIHDSYGKSLRKLGREHYLLLPAEGSGVLDAETNYLAVASEGVGPDYSNGLIGSNTTTYVLESLGSLAVNTLGAGALPAYPGAPLTQHVALEGGQVTLWKFTVPPGVAAMEVRLLNRVGSPFINLIPGTNAPYPHVVGGGNYGADGGWAAGRRDGTELLTIANPAAGTWTATLKAESVGGLYPDAACDVQIRAVAPANLTFNGGSVITTGHEPGTWKYYTVSVPAGADGWDLRLANVTAGTPLLRIRRDLLPDEAGAPGISWEWPSGSQLTVAGDWTGRSLNPDDSTNDGRLAMMARDNVLTNGIYYVGVFNANNGTPAAYTLMSRGVGTGYAIPVTPLNFSGVGAAHTNTAGLPAREAAYYRIVVPSNAPSWHIRATPTAGGELLLIWNSQVLPNSYWNPYGRQMQKPGKELLTWFASEGDVFLPPGTNCFAVVSEGMSPLDASHVGTNNVPYRIESLGPVPLVDLGVLPLAGPPLTQHVSLEGAEVKLFRFNTTTLIPSVELRLTNRLGNPVAALRPGTNAPMPISTFYSYYGVAGGYSSARQEHAELITLANVASGAYTFTVFALDDGTGTFPDAEADLSLTPRPPTDLAFLTGNESVSGQLPNTWRFFKVTVPGDTEGWELRLAGSGSGPAQMSVRRGVLPEPSAPGTSIYDTTWPDRAQINASSDWTGLNDNDGTSSYGRFLGFGKNNPLEPDTTYYVGVLNSSATEPVSYTLASRGIGGAGGLPITTLAFAGGTVSPAPLPARNLAYYKLEIPADQPSWRVRLDTSAGGESRLLIHKDHVPNTGNAAYTYPVSSLGKGLAKAGKEHYVLFPEEGQSSIAAGTYYLAVVSEGVNPALPNIGTGDSTFTLESHGALPVTELGFVPAVGAMISHHVTLEGGETKAFHFDAAGGADWVEVRLANRLGNPALAERPGAELPIPSVPANYASYGSDGGWSSGRKETFTLLTLVRPPPTNTITVKGELFSSEYPDAEADIQIRQRAPSSLAFSNGLVTGSLADNERVFYQVIVPTNQIGWRLQLTATNGTPTVRAQKDLLPSDDEPCMGFGGPSIIIAPPFLEAGTWYVEVKGGGATEFRLTSNPVVTQRPAWAMPAYGASVTTSGLPPAGPLFADTGVGTNGLALPDDQGTDLGVGDFHFYSFTVPPGNVGLLRAELDAISGNPDLYIRRGGVPTFDHPEFGYYGASLVDYELTGTGTEYGNWVPLYGRTETQLGTGTWYVSVRASASNVRYRLKLSVGTMTPLTAGATLGGQVLAGNDWRYYRIMVPSNAPQSLTITWSQQQGDAELRLRDTIPPGEPLDYSYREWSRDGKNGGPYPSFPDPGTYTLSVPTVRPNTPLYLGFHAAGGDASFTVGVNFSAQNLDITNVVAFYGGVKTVTVPAFGTAKFRVPVPADATSWRHWNTHSGDIQIYLDQGTLPDVWGTGYRIWESGGAPDSQLVQFLYGWPWVPDQHYFFIATNTAATPQSLTIRMDGRNAATDDTDGDGLPDGWEIFYFGNLDQTGSDDPDGDGINNATELAEGTNPASAASFRPRLTVTTVGLGSVVIAPNLPSYALGQLVTLTAVPDAGQFFNAWSGDASGVVNPLTFSMNGHKTITANFSGEATPLVFTNTAVNGSSHFTATITGPAGAALVVLGSADLSTWLPIVTNAPFTGTFNFTDPSPANATLRTYRARLIP